MDKLLKKEILVPIISIVVAILLYIVLSKLVKKVFNAKTKIDQRKQKAVCTLINNILKMLLIVIVAVIILNEFGVDTAALITSLGVVGLVLGLALQDILKDVIAGISIMLEDQFAVGDHITIGNFKGEVISLGVRTTRVKSYTGEVQIINNRMITSIVNHSLASGRAIIEIVVAYDSDYDKVEKVINEVCKEVNTKQEVLKSELKLLGINKLLPNGVSYQIIGKTKPGEHSKIEKETKRLLIEKFSKNKIEIRGGS